MSGHAVFGSLFAAEEVKTPACSLRLALCRLLAVQGWMRLGKARDGRDYGPGFFTRRAWGENLVWKNRRVSFRLARYTECIACGSALPPNGTLDHLIPKSRGGPDDATNLLPLCRPCNSRKGTKDLMEWWGQEGRKLVDLPPDAICAYARLMYECTQPEVLDGPAPDGLLSVIGTYQEVLSPAHWAALMRVR